MSANAFTGHALCQALILEGFSERTEANVERRLRHLWENNGPDFVIDTLKVLKADTERSLVDASHRYKYTDGISVSWNHRQSRPKGPLGCFYTKYPDPRDRIRVLGAAINAITYEVATKKQMDKFVRNIRSNSSCDFSYRFNDRFLKRLEDRLARHVLNVKEPFGPQHLTNRMLPYGCLTVNIGDSKKQLHAAVTDRAFSTSRETYLAVLKLDSNVKGQFYTAPRFCKKRWNRILDLAGVDDATKALIRYPSKIAPRPLMARDYERSPRYGILALDCAEYSPRGTADYLGRLDFLQKPGGKLRSVANVNRFVNYTMEPFAKALEDTFYSMPGVGVLDQAKALRDVSKFLSDNDGKLSLTSMDLTAATDTIDFRVFTRALARDFEGSTGLLKEYAEYFTEMAQLPLYCEPLEAAVQFRTGQPLGMKGSFQILTAMNFLAAKLASFRAGDKDSFFRVVGDDLVCDSRIASHYSKIMSYWGGSTNLEKSMESPVVAEFLSHLVTKDNVYITKPKYSPSSKALFTNLEKAKSRDLRKIFKLNQHEKDAVEILSLYSVDKLDHRSSLPRLRSKSLSTSDFDLEVMSTALRNLTEWRGVRESLSLELSELTIEFMYLEHPSVIESTFAPVIDGSQIASGPVRQSVSTFPTSDMVYDHRTGKMLDYISSSMSYRAALSKADDMRALHESYVTGRNHEIDLGYGLKTDSDSIILAAIEEVSKREEELRNRKDSSTHFSPSIQDAPRVSETLDPVDAFLLKYTGQVSKRGGSKSRDRDR